jgi:hypothetical protein
VTLEIAAVRLAPAIRRETLIALAGRNHHGCNLEMQMRAVME